MYDLTNVKHTHLVGIKGSGMAALAQLLLADGIVVTGSDVAEYFFTDDTLKQLGIVPKLFTVDNITEDVDMVIYSAAWEDHDECKAAREKRVPLMSYAQAIAYYFNSRYGIAVAGSHGKTTTSAMLAYVLSELGKDPTAVIGSRVTQFGTNALVGHSDYFVLEADEYKNKLALYEPKATILTSVDYDHPDFFKTFHDYKKVFVDFLSKDCQKNIVVCSDNGGVGILLNDIEQGNVITYGWNVDAYYRGINYRIEEGQGVFEVLKNGASLGEFYIGLVGQHNASNAISIIALCDMMHIPLDAAFTQALSSFKGTARRFEQKGVVGETIIIDDYAHHPIEVQATLEAAKKHFDGKRIWCVFVPHTFSRTAALLEEFAHSFRDVEKVIVLDIYASAREVANETEVTSKDLVEKINVLSRNAIHVHSNADAVVFLKDHLDEIDVLITMGAGDVWKVGADLLEDI